jgi:hypothetical protein
VVNLYNNIREGNGVLNYNNKEKYEGKWENDQKNGKGKA